MTLKKLFVALSFACACLSFAYATSSAPVDSSEKKILKIAFLFPFNANKVFITDLEESDFYFPEESQVSIEFYQGALLALDSLKKTGLNIKVWTYDVGNDSLKLKTVLLKPELKQVDFIMGPLGGQSLKLAAEYAKRDSIPLISPLSATFISTEENPYLILANATIETHCKAIYDYIFQKELAHRTFLIYRKRPQDLEMVKYIKDHRDSLKAHGSPSIHFIEMTDSSKASYFKLRDSLFTTDKNIILIPSNDEAFVRNIMRMVTNLHSDYEIEVFGMPTWKNFDWASSEKPDSTVTLISSSFYLDKSSSAATKFKTAYVEKFDVDPTEFSVRGYDEALYYVQAFSNRKEDEIVSFPASHTQQIGCAFKPAAISKPGTNSICYFANLSVYFLKYENGTWIKVK